MNLSRNEKLVCEGKSLSLAYQYEHAVQNLSLK